MISCDFERSPMHLSDSMFIFSFFWIRISRISSSYFQFMDSSEFSVWGSNFIFSPFERSRNSVSYMVSTAFQVPWDSLGAARSSDTPHQVTFPIIVFIYQRKQGFWYEHWNRELRNQSQLMVIRSLQKKGLVMITLWLCNVKDPVKTLVRKRENLFQGSISNFLEKFHSSIKIPNSTVYRSDSVPMMNLLSWLRSLALFVEL